MSVEYFSWSSLECATLKERLLAELSTRRSMFVDEVANEPDDGENRAITWRFRRDLAGELKKWCDHFQVDRLPERTYERVRPGNFGGQSWMVRFDLAAAVDSIVDRLGPAGERLYRPKVLERATAEVMRWLKRRPSDVDRIHHRTFEAIVAEVLRDSGWTVELTKMTRDGGYDVLALRTDALGFVTTAIVECKLYDLDRAVGVAMVDRVVGVRHREHADLGVLVTNTRFSADAWKAWESDVGRDLL